MNISKQRIKKKLCIQHRRYQYLEAVNRVVEGTAKPNYMTLRWKKLKSIEGR